MSPLKSTYFCFVTILWVSIVATHRERKSGREKEISRFPRYDLHRTDELPSDRQVTTFLARGESKTFKYNSTLNNASLSITIITCTSSVNWIVRFHRDGTPLTEQSDNQMHNLTTEGVKTLHITSLAGMYTLQITAVAQNTFLHIYISTEPGGSLAMRSAQNKLKFRKRQRKRLTVRWDPSLVDPQVTEYCLVIGSQKHYPTLCSAYGDKYGIPSPLTNDKRKAQTKITKGNYSRNFSYNQEPFITCVGSRTHLTLSELRQNQEYYLDLFAVNKQSNLTYLYAYSFMKFEKRSKPERLKDNKSIYVNLKKFDGRVVFRYKVGKIYGDSLKLYVTPCGGAVDVDVNYKGETVASQRGASGFSHLIIGDIAVGKQYYVKIVSSNKEELRRISGVEVLATTRPSSKTQLPDMPSESSVQEYFSLRKCDSITVGWLASPGQHVARYCLIVREGRVKELDSLRIPNQCGLEARLRKSADFSMKYCRDVKQENEQVLTQTIKQLKPGKSYVIQVTVKKPKGKTLSYNLLQVQTKPKCWP